MAMAATVLQTQVETVETLGVACTQMAFNSLDLDLQLQACSNM